MFKIFVNIFLLLFAVLIMTSCGTYQKVYKSRDWDYKFEKAKEYYNEKDYYHALPLFESLIQEGRGIRDIEKLYFYYAYSHFGAGDVTLAAYHFKNFTTNYPNSEYAEKAQFMYAYCYYVMTPGPSLDQSNGQKAIEAFQLFANIYPESDSLKKSNEYIDELRGTMQQKAFKNAKLYFNIGYYQSASIAFQNVLRNYPDIKNKEEVYFLMLKSNFLYAENSIASKQPERYKETLEVYKKFNKKFPESSYSKEVASIHESTIKAIEKFESDGQQKTGKVFSSNTNERPE